MHVHRCVPARIRTGPNPWRKLLADVRHLSQLLHVHEPTGSLDWNLYFGTTCCCAASELLLHLHKALAPASVKSVYDSHDRWFDPPTAKLSQSACKFPGRKVLHSRLPQTLA